jgi:hypothetical protein
MGQGEVSTTSSDVSRSRSKMSILAEVMSKGCNPRDKVVGINNSGGIERRETTVVIKQKKRLFLKGIEFGAWRRALRIAPACQYLVEACCIISADATLGLPMCGFEYCNWFRGKTR